MSSLLEWYMIFCSVSSLSDRPRQTEAPYATAWNGYRYIGRIRPSDGLVVLLREPVRDSFRYRTIVPLCFTDGSSES